MRGKNMFIRMMLFGSVGFIGISLHAQALKFETGLQGGPSLVFIRGNEFIEKYHEPRISSAASFFFQCNFSLNFSLRADPGFERKGSVRHLTATDYEGNPI